MPVLRSGPLAAWTTAWVQGRQSLDQVVDAVTGTDAPHVVIGLLEVDPAPLRDLLIAWRQSGAQVRAVLPVPGDVRGLPGPAAFRDAALEVGEGIVCGDLGATPQVTEHGPSSAPTTVVWAVAAVEAEPPDPLSIEDAQYELTTVIRESASALAAASVAGASGPVAESLQDARRAGERLNLPPGFPPRAVALLAQAERLQAVLDLAAADPVGGAVDRVGIAARTEALRPLATAVRRARVAGYNGQIC